MSMADLTEGATQSHPQTAIRRFADRARSLSLASQMVECVDLLQQPELLVAEIGESVEEVREQKDDRAGTRLVSSLGEDRSAFFYPSRELFVQGDGCSFTCLATELDFHDEKPPASADPGLPMPSAIDYAGVTCESRPFPVLGFPPTIPQNCHHAGRS